MNLTQKRKLAGISYLGITNQSSKLMKNLKVNNVLTYSVYLSPAHTSGYEVCPNATPECRMGCLNNSGLAKVEYHAGMSRIKDARITKTKLFFENNDLFMSILVDEIESAIRKAKKNDALFSIRLNCTSDIDWVNVLFNGKNIFQIFPDVEFYDYTKNFKKFDNKPVNYHLTFSYTGYNWSLAKKVLSMGHNIAMVFNINKHDILPLTYKGIEIISGDLSDYRINDTNGVIVGLVWKKIGNKKHNELVRYSNFCVQPTDKNLEYPKLEIFKDEILSKVA